jgi:replication factor C subunit 1
MNKLEIDSNKVQPKGKKSPSPPKETKPKRGQASPDKRKQSGATSEMSVNGCLENLSFVVSGVFNNITREKVEMMIKDKGGRLVGSVSGKTDYLVMGHKLEDGREPHQGGKHIKAKERGKPILDEEGFEKLVREKSGDPSFVLSQREKIIKEVSELPSKPKPSGDNSEGFETQLWTEIYKPLGLGDLVGNSGTIDEIFRWLKDWDDVVIKGNKKTVNWRGNWENAPKPNARACLLSGPPGIGKTSSAKIICQALGYEVVEQNASDIRNKAAIELSIKTLSGNQSMDYFYKPKSIFDKAPVVQPKDAVSSKKSVIIMDEVDGVGAGDRGGIKALIDIIKATRTPIICICNDR